MRDNAFQGQSRYVFSHLRAGCPVLQIRVHVFLTFHKTVMPQLFFLRVVSGYSRGEANMHIHQVVQATQAKTSDRWREAVRERWRVTLLSAWERDALVEDGTARACSPQVVFLRQKPRMLRNSAACK